MRPRKPEAPRPPAPKQRKPPKPKLKPIGPAKGKAKLKPIGTHKGGKVKITPLNNLRKKNK